MSRAQGLAFPVGGVVALALALACGRGGAPAAPDGGGAAATGGSSGGSGGSGGSADAGAGGGVGAAGETGSAGGAGAGGETGDADGAAGAGDSTGADGAASASDASDGEADGGGDAGPDGPVGTRGCRAALASDDVRGKFVARAVKVTGLAGVYLPGGALAQADGVFDLTNRPYAVRLPANYDATTPLAVRFEGGGCGRSATTFVTTPSSGYPIDPGNQVPAVEVALNPVGACFLDGGPTIDKRADSPEVPYFRAVLADVESRYCVDRARVFVTGDYSGAWEAQLLGCAAADVVRGIATFSGGLRAHRPACTGPVAAMLIGSTMDQSSPLGPLAPTDPAFIRNDSPGLVPLRDDVLARNGCIGTGTAPWKSTFPACLTFTGCPAAFPVVWCPLESSARNPMALGAMRYAPNAMLPFLSELPDLP